MDKDTLDRIINTVVTYGDPADAEALRNTLSDTVSQAAQADQLPKGFFVHPYGPSKKEQAYHQLPDNFHANGDLEVTGESVTELPKGLRVEGYLDISRTGIKALPEDLSIGYSLLAAHTPLDSLPDSLKRVDGELDLRHSSITRLPDGLQVGGSLDLEGCSGLTSLPNGLAVGDHLDLSGTGVTELPDDLMVGGRPCLKWGPLTAAGTDSLPRIDAAKYITLQMLDEGYVCRLTSDVSGIERVIAQADSLADFNALWAEAEAKQTGTLMFDDELSWEMEYVISGRLTPPEETVTDHDKEGPIGDKLTDLMNVGALEWPASTENWTARTVKADYRRLLDLATHLEDEANSIQSSTARFGDDTLVSLTKEYDRWLEQTGYEPQSADELYCELLGRDDVDPDHLEWLSRFTQRWEAAEDRERETHAADDMSPDQETASPSNGPSMG